MKTQEWVNNTCSGDFRCSQLGSVVRRYRPIFNQEEVMKTLTFVVAVLCMIASDSLFAGEVQSVLTVPQPVAQVTQVTQAVVPARTQVLEPQRTVQTVMVPAKVVTETQRTIEVPEVQVQAAPVQAVCCQTVQAAPVVQTVCTCQTQAVPQVAPGGCCILERFRARRLARQQARQLRRAPVSTVATYTPTASYGIAAP